MSISARTKSFLISGMASTFAGNELANAIENEATLSTLAFTRLQDAFSEDDIASNFQACILGTYALSPRDVFFVKDAFSLDVEALADVIANLAGGVQAPISPNFQPPSTPNSFPNAFANSSPSKGTMPAGFSFAVNFVGPAYQQWDVMNFPAGSTFASTGAGKYWEIFTGGNSNQYYVWYSVSGGSNTDPAPAGFTGIEVVILSGDTAAQVASKTNIAMAAAAPQSSFLGSAATYAILGASAVTGSTGAGSVLTGDLGIYPNNATSITNFPPSVYSGTENAGNAAAHTAQNDALAAYTAQTTHAGYVAIPSTLDGQSFTAGYYSEASGTFNLAASGPGTLTLTGSATDIFVFKAASTLTTGSGGTPTITLAGGVLAANVYWLVGSSATINSGFTGTFQGNIIAQASITDTLGGTVNGSLIALTGAVTLSATAHVNVQAEGPGSVGLANASSSVTGNAMTVILGPTPSQVSRPAFSKNSGTYHGTQSVTITSGTSGAAIYYTTSGTIPTPSSTLYTGPISVASSETVQAIAVKAGMANSAVGSVTYTIT